MTTIGSRDRTLSELLGATETAVTADSSVAALRFEADGRGEQGVLTQIRTRQHTGFTGIRLVVTLRGPESPARYAALQQTADAHCPVLDLFASPTPVATTLAAGTAGSTSA